MSKESNTFLILTPNPLMATETSKIPEGQSSGSAPKKEGSARLSPFMKSQIELQDRLGCDYALLWYERDAKSPPGQMPNYICIGDPIPVKLSHHVFMQMAFSILKDRLKKAPIRKKPQSSGSSAKSEVKEEVRKKKEEEEEPEQPPPAEKKDEEVNTGENSATSPSAGPPVPEACNARERDTAALFCFLWHYVTSMMASEHEALCEASGNDGSHKGKRNSFPKPTVRMTKQQLRFQMLLEYGVDVHRVLGDGLPTTNVFTEQYCKGLMTDSITEEEFNQQLAKSSRMAQVCSVM